MRWPTACVDCAVKLSFYSPLIRYGNEELWWRASEIAGAVRKEFRSGRVRLSELGACMADLVASDFEALEAAGLRYGYIIAIALYLHHIFLPVIVQDVQFSVPVRIDLFSHFVLWVPFKSRKLLRNQIDHGNECRAARTLCTISCQLPPCMCCM